MTAALGRMEEFRLHVGARSRTGVTDDELDELLFQIAAYCGAPAGVSARRSLLAVRAEEQTRSADLAMTTSASSGWGTWAACWRPTWSTPATTSSPMTSPGRRAIPPAPTFVDDVAELAARADVVVLSLPDGAVSPAGSRRDRRRARGGGPAQIVDTSTIGVEAARAIDARWPQPASPMSTRRCPAASPEPGRARSRSCMPGRTRHAMTVQPVLAGLSDRRRRVGDRPGMAQALKLANNFLSATALAATSEAVAFGLSVGLDMATMIEVLDTSSGQSAATSDKFPNHVLTGRYGAGFTNSLMAKDLRLYLGAVGRRGRPVDGGAGHRGRSGSASPTGGAGRRLHPDLPVRGGVGRMSR